MNTKTFKKEVLKFHKKVLKAHYFKAAFLAFVFLTSVVIITKANTGSARDSSSSGEIIISEDSSGFHPSSITIHLGQRVKFISSRGKDFWPASDLHPTHTLYPEFDPKHPIAAGESYVFTFTQPGEWGFHDHLYSDFTGKINVLATGETTISSRPDCQDVESLPASEKGRRYSCWEDTIARVLKDKGLAAAFELMDKMYRSNQEFASDCHWFGHLIGKYAYKQVASNQTIKVAPTANYCAFGFYHGFMEALIQGGGDIKLAKDLCHQANQDIPDSNQRMPAVLLACYHGIGHGATEIHQESGNANDEEVIAPGLRICDSISSSTIENYRCAGGVFNVLSIAYNSNNSAIKINKSDPLWVCNKQPDRFRDACYGDMNVALNGLTKSDLAAAAKFVEQITEDKWAKPAIVSLAAAAASTHLKDSDGYLGLTMACRGLQERLHLNCIRGIASGLAEYGPPDDELTPALKFCQDDFLSEEERSFCVGETLKFGRSIYTAEKAREFCNKVPEKYRKVCDWS